MSHLTILACFAVLCAGTRLHAAETPGNFENDIRPFLAKCCRKCRSGEKPEGEVSLTDFRTEACLRMARPVRRTVLTVVRNDEMPPDNPLLPSPSERLKPAAWIRRATAIKWAKVRNPGHMTHEPAVEKILASVEADNFRAATLVEQIVPSYPFPCQTGWNPKEE